MSGGSPRAVVIGASAGAVQALSEIMRRLPAGYPLPILVVVHVPETPSGLTALFADMASVAIREPEDKEPIHPGTVYIAPPGYHLLVEKDDSLALSADEPVLFSRPSIDVLFESAADAFREHLIAIVLTGANEDGARGAAAVHAAGGTVLVEDPASAYAPAMPTAAIARCPAAIVRSLSGITDYLLELGTT